MKRVAALITASVLVILVGFFEVGTSSGSGVEFPKDLNVVLPGSEVSTSIAAFSGMWDSGKSIDTRRVIIVEKITGSAATVVYATDVPARLRSGRGGWKRYDGVVDVDKRSIVYKGPGRDFNGSPVSLVFTLKLKEDLLLLKIEGGIGFSPIETTLSRVLLDIGK